ncbi:hypothetical protein EV126DRAFT_136079 [Verticillium dahliae]|nr:hypothetical protein EV126DRAFT_136079 [Verticillium dahliae]
MAMISIPRWALWAGELDMSPIVGVCSIGCWMRLHFKHVKDTRIEDCESAACLGEVDPKLSAPWTWHFPLITVCHVLGVVLFQLCISWK